MADDDDWDPFAVDEPAPAPTPKAAAPAAAAAEGEARGVCRIGKDHMGTCATGVVEELKKKAPWSKSTDSKPDLQWHTASYSIADWKHHDVLCKVSDDGALAYIIFNRGNENNTMQETLGAGINDALMGLHARPDIKVAVFTGEGRMYCAGGDPKGWQAAAAGGGGGDGTVGVRVPLQIPTEDTQRHQWELGQRALMMGAFPDGNVNIGRIMAAMQWNTWALLPQLTICLANGSAMGGGVGCVCCCDMVVSLKKSYFSLSEVKIGVVPATISPYVVSKIGTANSKRLMCTAENLTAKRALEMGMVNHVVDNMKEGYKVIAEMCEGLSKIGPKAVGAAKELLLSCAGRELNESLLFTTCKLLKAAQGSDEYAVGLEADTKGTKTPWESNPLVVKQPVLSEMY